MATNDTTSPASVLNEKALQAWLASKKEDEVVGRAQSPQACPIARFLIDQGARDPYVERDDFWLDGSDTSGDLEMPDWAAEFVDLVDANGDGAEITASDALDILAEVTL